MHNLESSYLTISFNSNDDEENGFYELLMKKIPIKSAGMHRYTLSRENLAILDKVGLKFNIEKDNTK